MPKTSKKKLEQIKQWRLQHPEKVKGYEQKRYEKRKESGYYQSEKYKKYLKKDKERRKQYQKEYLRKYRQRIREEADKIFGKKCYICDRERRLVFHKKDGEKHQHTLTALLALKNPEEYVKLCEWCHKAVHWLMEWFDMTWEDIIKKLIKKKKLLYSS